jgi:hypothetical protein
VLPGGRIILGRWWFASVSQLLANPVLGGDAAVARLARKVLGEGVDAMLKGFADWETFKDENIDFNDEYGGPFIFWAVEPEDEELDGGEE